MKSLDEVIDQLIDCHTNWARWSQTSDIVDRSAVEDAIEYLKEYRDAADTNTERTFIRCADCKWWDRLEDGHPYGYCRACKSGTHTERWDISIYRQNRYDFYCADAEPKEEEDENAR